VVYEKSLSAPSRAAARRWRLQVESSPERLGRSAEAYWRELIAARALAGPVPPDLGARCAASAAALQRPFESDTFCFASTAGLAIDFSVFRGRRDWVLLCRPARPHSAGLARLAFVYSALARSRDAVVYTDAAGTLLGASERWLALYGFEPLDVLGENPRVINSRQHPRSFFRDLFTQLVDPAIGTWSGEIFNRSKSGDLIQVWQTITTFPDETGAVSGYLGITRDMTAHRELRERLLRTNEELAARLRAQEELLSMTVHDLRSPLHAALGFIELARLDIEGRSDGRAAARLDRAREAGERLESLIQSLLDAQRAHSGRLELSASRLWVSSVLRSEVELHRVHAARKKVAIELTQTGPSLPGFFDELRLGEAISNVLANAVKFSPSGGTIRVRLESCGDGEHEILVDDPGPGIPDADREAVFQLYYQAGLDARPASERGGSGWGLYIARRVVELHGGELVALDSPEGGCRMRLRFRSLPGVWERRPWAAVVFDPAEEIWAELSAKLLESGTPVLASHSFEDLGMLVEKELPNLVFAPAGEIDAAALRGRVSSAAGGGSEPAVVCMARSPSGLVVVEASGPPALVETVLRAFPGNGKARPVREDEP
jgi:PAS domain S-box-containing protein